MILTWASSHGRRHVFKNLSSFPFTKLFYQRFYPQKNRTTSLYNTDNMPQKTAAVRRHCVIIKRYIKNNSGNISVTEYIGWFLGFCWRAYFYTENCLPFRLSTSSFIFHLFSEVFHWVLLSFLGWDLEHYLDNFFVPLPEVAATPDKIWIKSDDHAHFTEIIRIL